MNTDGSINTGGTVPEADAELVALRERAAAAAAQMASTPGSESPEMEPVNIAPQPATEGAPQPAAPTPEDVAQQFIAQQGGEVRYAAPVRNPFAVPDGAGYLTREQVREAAQERRNRGVEIFLPVTGTKATVRDLPFTDYTMLVGIPAEIRQLIDDTIKDRKAEEIAATGTDNAQSLSEALELYGKAEQMANGVCIAAFIKPRLVMRVEELDGDPDTWLVSDIESEDRIAFLNWVQRDRTARAMQQGGDVAVAGFPG